MDLHAVDVKNSLRLRPLIAPGRVVISESGLRDAETLIQLKRSGFDGFLIGEYFMADAHPHLKCADFIRSVHHAMQRTQLTSA
jgi:indole-3-glycerol phosphate synthase